MYVLEMRVWGACFGDEGLGFVSKAHRLLYHSTIGSRVIRKRRREGMRFIEDGHGGGEREGQRCRV